MRVCVCAALMTLCQTSEHTRAELKIVLLEFLGSNNRAPDTSDLIPFVMGRVEHETHDKTRACAVLALEVLSRFDPPTAIEKSLVV